jgi:hypothetical protein
MDFETPSHSPPQINVNPQRREPSDGFGVGGRPHLVRVGSMDFLGPASVGSYGGWRGAEGEQDNGDRGNRMGKVLRFVSCSFFPRIARLFGAIDEDAHGLPFIPAVSSSHLRALVLFMTRPSFF